MKKYIFVLFCLMLGGSAIAQQKIQLRSADKAECVKSDMTSLRATFSFSTIEAQDYESERGTFSWLSLPNTVIGGNEGDPQIPVVNELIAIPVGANPYIEIVGYSTAEYHLEDYGIHTLMPRQLPLRKSQTPDDVPFIMNEAAYQTRGLSNGPEALVEVEGTMRGVHLGKITIEPVSYDPVSNTIRVFNDIEVEVHFDGADKKATEDLLLETYSPYFDVVYKQLFNGRAVLDTYTDHPDLYKTPVKMLVVTTSTYANSTAFQSWLTWKKQKGIAVDVQVVANNANSTTIKNLIYSRYNANHPSFLVLVGDETVVTYYTLWDYDSSYGNAASDLEYASVDGDVYHDMFLSRMPVSSTTELNNLVNKILMYEKYTMPDPSYLDETLLIAGWDSDATEYIGKPTIQYANNYYFNSAHGITPHVFITTGSGQTTCYNYINQVGFVNYTAHGDIQKWHDPQFTNTNVNSLSNTNKYFWAMGNCCLTANFKNAQNNLTCFGEAMVRAANKGAWGYIGSIPESLWYEDYYFAVGATNTFGQMPTQTQTKTGAYDALFDETSFNTLNAVPFIGNVAVSYAHANGYTSSVNDEYYWRAYYCFGDGSVMPYLKKPAANTVSHAGTFAIGQPTYTVSADPGSYVSITIDNEIVGVAQVPSNGTVEVPLYAGVPGNGMIVVTRNQRQPYIGNITVTGEGAQYNITSMPSDHGTVDVPTQAWANTKVDLTATPDSGYTLDRWVVFKTGDVNTTVTVNDNSFIMPDNDVTVYATFQAQQTDVVPIGSGTETASGSDIPTDVYYKYCISQQIYTSAEVGDASDITALSFYYNSSISSGNRTLAIYMSNTSSSTITTWQTESASHQVYLGSHNFTQGWNTIQLDTPFAYDGKSNVLLTVDDNTGSYYNISQYIYFYTYPTNANRAIYYRNDNNNPSPLGNISYSATKTQYNAQVRMTQQTVGGEVFVKCITGYGANDGRWSLIASPLADATAATDVFNMTGNEYDLYRFNQSADKEWENWKTTGSNYHFNLESGRGYLYANSNDVVLTFVGTPYSGNGKVTLTKDAGARLSGWNLIGNPFGNAATMPKDFYRMNADGTGFIASTDHNVAPMEGVMVYASSDGEIVTFTENAKDEAPCAQIVLNMRQGDGDVLDRVIVRFSDGGMLPKCSLDDNTAKIYIPHDDADYAVVHGDAVGEMSVSFIAGMIGQYSFSVDIEDADVNYLHLIDKLTGDDTDMLLEGVYTFIGSPSDSGDRFVLRFAHSDANGTEDDVFAYQSGNNIVVSGNGTLLVYDVMGRFVSSHEIDGMTTIVKPAENGVYILRMTGQETKTQKLVLR